MPDEPTEEATQDFSEITDSLQPEEESTTNVPTTTLQFLNSVIFINVWNWKNLSTSFTETLSLDIKNNSR
jgi:hypothetical protein